MDHDLRSPGGLDLPELPQCRIDPDIHIKVHQNPRLYAYRDAVTGHAGDFGILCDTSDFKSCAYFLKNMPEKIPQNRPDYALLGKVGTISSAILFLTLLGHWVDLKFGTSYIFTMIGAGLGVLYSLYETWVLLRGNK
jgi:hypothetical protein